MDTIELKSILPNVFATRSEINSDVWHKEVKFDRDNIYLINAPSGTGKSSLCSFIFGYRNDYGGRILFDQTNIRQYSSNAWNQCRQREISVVFQDLKLFDELTVMENIQIKNKLTKYKSKKEIVSLLEYLEIGDKVDTPIQLLSLGQKQRVAILRGICQPFNFILLDEPISHLDKDNSDKIAKLILDEAKGQEAGIIVTSLGNQLDIPYTTVYNL